MRLKKAKSSPGLVKESRTASVDSVTAKLKVDSVPKNIQVDSVIQLAFAADSISVTVKGHLDKKGDPVICYLPVTKGEEVNGQCYSRKSKGEYSVQSPVFTQREIGWSF